MKIYAMAATLVLISSASVVESKAAYAAQSGIIAVASSLTPVGSVSANGDNEDWYETLQRDIQGYPAPNNHRCTLVSQPVTDARGKFIGYHTFNVCK